MKVAFYTRGNMGAGHLMRGFAIENGLKRYDSHTEFRMFGGSIHIPYIDTPKNYEVSDDAISDLIDIHNSSGTVLFNQLERYQPNLILVDCFWMPLIRILPQLNCQAWLLLRWVPDVWLSGPSHLPFEPDQYKKIIAIEPFELKNITDTIDPICIYNLDECQPESALKQRLGLSKENNLTVVMQAGKENEANQLMQYTDKKEIVYAADLFKNKELFPAAAWLGGADRIICGAGYNAYWESRWLGYFDRTEFMPFKRSIDNQSWRIKTCSGKPMNANGADTLAEMINCQ